MRKGFVWMALGALLSIAQPCNVVWANDCEDVELSVESDFEDIFTDTEEDIIFESGETAILFDDHEESPEDVFSDHEENIQNEFEIEFELKDSSVVSTGEDYGVSFFSRRMFSGCYGNQLTGLSREIYDHFVTQYVVNDAHVDSDYTLTTPVTFCAEIRDGALVQNEGYLEARTTIQAATQAATDAFMYDYPEEFWFGAGKQTFSISVYPDAEGNYIGSIKKISIKVRESYKGALRDVYLYEERVENAIRNIPKSSSRYMFVKNIHDYICENVYYSTIDTGIQHSSAGFFIGNAGVVCEGYAKSFKVLCDRFGIPCVCVSGNTQAGGSNDSIKGHMWNYVQMDDGNWYLVDVTWDDQDEKIYDTYLLAGWYSDGFYVPIINERIERTDFSLSGFMNFAYPPLSEQAYKKNSSDMQAQCIVNGHNWDRGTIIKEASCILAGEKKYTCKNCGGTKTEEFSGGKHGKTVVTNAKAATCESKGYTGDICCEDCGFVTGKGETIKATGHKWGSWTVARKATALKEGVKQSICTRCKKKNVASIKKLTPTYKVNMKSIPLKVGQSTTKLVISGLAAGDYVKSYKSSNTKIAAVGKTGKILARKRGTAQIVVTLASGKQIKIPVKVQTSTVQTTKVSVNSTRVSLKVGKTFAIKASVLPLTSQQKVTYTVANKKIATVSSTGKIVARKKGKTIIVVKSGSKSTKISVTVK